MRERGHPSANDPRYDAEGNYIPDLRNDGGIRFEHLTGSEATPACLELARRDGLNPQDQHGPRRRLRADALYNRAADLYRQVTGRVLFPDYFRKRHTRKWLADGADVLDVL